MLFTFALDGQIMLVSVVSTHSAAAILSALIRLL